MNCRVIAYADRKDSVQAVEEKIERLQASLASAELEQKSLLAQADLTRSRLGRAAKLTSALAEEGVRWQHTSAALQVCPALVQVAHITKFVIYCI